MRWLDNMAEKVRENMRSFLKIDAPQMTTFQITENMDYYANSAVNRIWERGDAEELVQLYREMPGQVNNIRFWAAVPTIGNDINKLHTGLPKLMCRIITDIVMADMNEIIVDAKYKAEWKDIQKENSFDDLVEEAIKEALIVGDGAFKISADSALSEYPIIEFVPGDNVEYVYIRGRLKEIIFRTPYHKKGGTYVLKERYGKGYIISSLLKNGNEIPLDSIDETKGLSEQVTFDKSFMMAKQFMIFKSSKYKGRGASIFDGKADSFDSLDEAWSQWMDALRRGRSREYIPESMLPRNPQTGEVLRPAPFDNAYIKVDAPMKEDNKSAIEIKQPNIPHESYQSTYATALDLCLQGILSPSTLGIDLKKLDNGEAQREKEKVTLYTRNKIIQALQKTLPELIDTVFKVYSTLLEQPLEDVEAEIPFGEYASPSFEATVETVAQAKQSNIMSIEACVDELYGDSKDEEWKEQEITRLKAELGITVAEEPAANMEAGDFAVEMKE